MTGFGDLVDTLSQSHEALKPCLTPASSTNRGSLRRLNHLVSATCELDCGAWHGAHADTETDATKRLVCSQMRHKVWSEGLGPVRTWT